jgi:hypothetical protein
MAKSAIEWTESTWNPVTGCTKISPGCKHCYAERMAKRLHAMGQPLLAALGKLGWWCQAPIRPLRYGSGGGSGDGGGQGRGGGGGMGGGGGKGSSAPES